MKKLISSTLAVVVALFCVVFWCAAQPKDEDVYSAMSANPYQIHALPTQAKDINFVEAQINARQAAGENTCLLFGSSEFNYFEGCSSFPTVYFGEHNVGMGTMLIGNPWFQSLWQAIEVGALDDAIPQGKAVIFVSTQWFADYQNVAEDFCYAYSESALDQFLANNAISAETKEAVLQRVSSYGVDYHGNKSYSLFDLPTIIDNAIESPFNEISHASSLLEEAADCSQGAFLPMPSVYNSEIVAPDWDALKELSLNEAKAATNTNSLGIIDSYYENSFQSWIENTNAYEAKVGNPIYNDYEYDDFCLLLEICKQCNIEPLIVIMPVNGMAYDQTRFSVQDRQELYQLIRNVCDLYGVDYYDASVYEYEKYYIRDAMHLGWLGWADIDRVIYNFFMCE